MPSTANDEPAPPADSPPLLEEEPGSITVHTVDGEALDADAARRLSRQLWRAGFAAPALWLLNAVLFWPLLKGQGGGGVGDGVGVGVGSDGDPVVRLYAKRSAIGTAVVAAIVLPWAAAFTLGGPRLVGRALFDRLNVAGLDLDAYGLRF